MAVVKASNKAVAWVAASKAATRNQPRNKVVTSNQHSRPHHNSKLIRLQHKAVTSKLHHSNKVAINSARPHNHKAATSNRLSHSSARRWNRQSTLMTIFPSRCAVLLCKSSAYGKFMSQV